MYRFQRSKMTNIHEVIEEVHRNIKLFEYQVKIKVEKNTP